jgi:RimJ/RimL family protein N-acetyltransferase
MSLGRPGNATAVSLRTARLRIRELEASDWPAVHRYAADPRVVEYLWWGPNSEADTRTFIEKASNERRRSPRLDFDFVVALERSDAGFESGVEAPGGVIGGCSLHARGKPEYRTCEIGYCLVPETWRQGYATETVAALLDFAFATAGLHRVFALVDPDNGASVRLLERLGLRCEGHLHKDTLIRGVWRDSLIYATLAEEWTGRRRTTKP